MDTCHLLLCMQQFFNVIKISRTMISCVRSLLLTAIATGISWVKVTFCFLFFLFLHYHTFSLSVLCVSPSLFSLRYFSPLHCIPFLHFSARRRKMIHKGWRAVNSQHNPSTTIEGKDKTCHSSIFFSDILPQRSIFVSVKSVPVSMLNFLNRSEEAKTR